MFISKLLISSTSLILIGYCSICSCSRSETEERKISDASNGTGGLDFDLNDKVLGIVNVTRGLPSFVAQFGDFTLLQFALVVVVGGLLAGAAALLAEAHFFRLYYSDLFDGGVSGQISNYGAPPIYGAPNPPKEYGAPVPPSTYG